MIDPASIAAALRLLAEVHVAGGELRLAADGQPCVKFNGQPPAGMLERLKASRDPIITLLTPDRTGWCGADWHAFFNERAAIAEHDADMPRPVAEAEAYRLTVAEWLDRHMPATGPERCAWCGVAGEGPLLPFGVGRHAWVHAGCADAWRKARRAEAHAALAAIGIVLPADGLEVAA